MADVPGLPADVYFGGVEDALPDWRDETDDSDDPEQADEPDDNSAALGQLYGYDPSWLADEPAQDDSTK